MISLQCRSIYFNLLFKTFWGCPIAQWIQSTIISACQALHDLLLSCSAGHSLSPCPPSLQCAERFSNIAFLQDLSTAFPQHSVPVTTIPQNDHVLFTPLPLTLDPRILVGKDQVAFVYVSPAFFAQ